MAGGGLWIMLLLPMMSFALLTAVVIFTDDSAIDQARARREVAAPRGGVTTFSSKFCPTCGRPVQADRHICPYDDTPID